MYNLRNEHEFIDNDYQLALLLDNQEKEKFRKVKSDNFNSTLIHFFLYLYIIFFKLELK